MGDGGGKGNSKNFDVWFLWAPIGLGCDCDVLGSWKVCVLYKGTGVERVCSQLMIPILALLLFSAAGFWR